MLNSEKQLIKESKDKLKTVLKPKESKYKEGFREAMRIACSLMSDKSFIDMDGEIIELINKISENN